MSEVFSTFCQDVLQSFDATELISLLQSKAVSQAEVLDAVKLRAKKAHEKLGAITYMDETVRTRAIAPLSSPFAGLPIFIKDNIAVRGMPTRIGSKATPETLASNDGQIAAEFRNLGFTIMGKSALPAFGFNCSTEFDDDTPPVRNPWNTSYSAGGSSGGAAALVASGVIPMAHGNDGGGSIRIPAAVCGLVGLKTSHGRLIENERTRHLPLPIIVEGVLTRSVRDSIRFLIESEKRFGSKKLKPIGAIEGPSKVRLRIAVVYNSVLTKPCPETRAAVEETARLLSSLGHHVEETSHQVHPRFVDDFRTYWCFLAFLVTSLGKASFGSDFRPQQLDRFTRGLTKRFQREFYRLPFALKRLKADSRALGQASRGFDVILSPVLAKVTPKLGVLSPALPTDELLERLSQYVGYTPIANVSGAPALSLPMGVSQGGLPVGIQLSAHLGDDRKLLELALELEQAKPWRNLG